MAPPPLRWWLKLDCAKIDKSDLCRKLKESGGKSRAAPLHTHRVGLRSGVEVRVCIRVRLRVAAGGRGSGRDPWSLPRRPVKMIGSIRNVAIKIPAVGARPDAQQAEPSLCPDARNPP